jgi:putative restriction endonuclease
VVVSRAQVSSPGTSTIYQRGRRRVYAWSWQALTNPFGYADDGATLDQLAQKLVTTPEESEAVYRQVNNRGVAQDLFRRVLLLAYRQRCAFCGLSLKNALQAAHIIPWSQASHAQRLDPSNGLLLCATHHALFDAHVLTVSPDHRIVCRLDGLVAQRCTDADRYGAISLHGRLISVPVDQRLQPSVDALQYRASRITDVVS